MKEHTLTTIPTTSKQDSPHDRPEVNVLLVRIDAELEFVVAAGLDDRGVASVKLAGVQVVGELLVLKLKTIVMYSMQQLCIMVNMLSASARK